MYFLFLNSYFAARTSSIATIDSLDDYARYSDEGARDDEKVAGARNKQLYSHTLFQVV